LLFSDFCGIILNPKDMNNELQLLMEEVRKQAQAMSNTKIVLTMDDVAELTGMSKNYIYRLVHLRRIPHYKSPGGKRTYFKREEVEQWLLSHRVPTTEELQQQAEQYCANHLR